LIIKGRVWKFGNEINTDLIFPRSAFRVPIEEQLKFVFSDNRPGWTEMVEKGDLIIAGCNFGTGSSRAASGLLKRLGLGGLVADSINGLFYRNCIGYGFPAMQCQGVSEVFNEGDTAIIDLFNGIVINEQTKQELPGQKLSKHMIDILQAGGVENLLKNQGYIEK